MSLHRSMPSDKVGGGGGFGVGNPDPEKREAPGHKKIFFRPEFVPQFGLKKGRGGPFVSSLGSSTAHRGNVFYFN